MTKRKAVSILKTQIAKIVNIYEPSEFTRWKVQTLTYIQSFFKDASEYTVAQSYLNFPTASAEFERDLQELKNKLIALLNSYIETMEAIGVPNRGNFLTRMREGWLIFIMCLLFPAIFSGGLLFGKYLSDTQNIELRGEARTQRDTIIMLRAAQTALHIRGDSIANNKKRNTIE